MEALWVMLALAAGLFQSARNGIARSLSGEISPLLNSWSRFAFNLPFSGALFAFAIAVWGFPRISKEYYLLCLATGLSQLSGNVALIAAFRHANFARSIVLHKLEIVFTAVIGAAFFSEVPSLAGWLGILATGLGVLLMHRGRIRIELGAALAILAGLFLVFASFLLKEANETLAFLNPRVGSGRFEVALHTLFNVTWMEVVCLTAWLRLARPGELPLVSRHWRRMLLIGTTGFLGSMGWFWAYSLTLVAYVKAVGQVESLVAVLFSLLIWKERDVFRELPGMVLVVAGILVVLLGGARG